MQVMSRVLIMCHDSGKMAAFVHYHPTCNRRCLPSLTLICPYNDMAMTWYCETENEQAADRGEVAEMN